MPKVGRLRRFTSDGVYSVTVHGIYAHVGHGIGAHVDGCAPTVAVHIDGVSLCNYKVINNYRVVQHFGVFFLYIDARCGFVDGGGGVC